MKIFNYEVEIQTGKYPATGQPYIEIIDAIEGDRIAIGSVAMSEIKLSENEVIIKDYSENIGMVDALVENDVIMKPHRIVGSEFVDFPIAILKEKYRVK